MHRFLVLKFVLAQFKSRQQLVWENAVLRYQVRILRQKKHRFVLTAWQKTILLWLTRRLSQWKRSCLLVTPETLLRWHRRGFRKFWTLKCGRSPGRPEISPRTISLIRRMCRENPLWGSPRIREELLKLGFEISKATVEKYMLKGRRIPHQPWKVFLSNHASEIVAMDFLTVPTLKFRLLYVLVILSHDRRRILRMEVTPNVSETWVAQQLREAFPFQTFPMYLLHDRDQVFRQVGRLGIRTLVTAPRSPWQNGHVERAIGSIKRECLDHVIILNEQHLSRVLERYRTYYNRDRTHQALGMDSPLGRQIEMHGEIVSVPRVGGIHHRYERLAG